MACCAAAMFILLNIGYAFRSLLLPFLGGRGGAEKPNLAVTWSLGAPNEQSARPTPVHFPARSRFRTLILVATMAFASGFGIALANPQAGASVLSGYRLETLLQSSICRQLRNAFAVTRVSQRPR